MSHLKGGNTVLLIRGHAWGKGVDMGLSIGRPWITSDIQGESTTMEINGQAVTQTARYDQLGLSAELMRAIDKKG